LLHQNKIQEGSKQMTKKRFKAEVDYQIGEKVPGTFFHPNEQGFQLEPVTQLGCATGSDDYQ